MTPRRPFANRKCTKYLYFVHFPLKTLFLKKNHILYLTIYAMCAGSRRGSVNRPAFGQTLERVSRIFLSFLLIFFHAMQTLKKLLQSKKFWALIASIVSALSIFFVSSCSSSYRTAQRFTHYEGGDSTSFVLIFDQSAKVRKPKN